MSTGGHATGTALPTPDVAIVHDYLTQRGGAERVVVSLATAFPGAPLYTSFYESELTFAELRSADVHTLGINRIRLLRRRHRLALPLLAGAFSRLTVDAPVVICSSSGWAHGARTTGRKIVYCHTPARWLYQADRYLGSKPRGAARAGLRLQRRRLLEWDRAAAADADCFLANSTAVRDRIRSAYGRDAEVVPPPYAVDPSGAQRPVEGIEPGFALCVSRLLPYKNVDAILRAFAELDGERIVVAGTGPDERRLRSLALPNAVLLGAVDDDELRWLYANCRALVAASYEDFGLTPLEAAAFGKPSAVLRFGGYLDTVADGATGLFFDRPEPHDIGSAVRRLLATGWHEPTILEQASRFSEQRFAVRMREVVAAEAKEAR